MKTYKEMEVLRIKNNTDYSKMLKDGLITKEEFSLCVKEIQKEIKTNHEKAGFRTDTFKLKDLNY